MTFYTFRESVDTGISSIVTVFIASITEGIMKYIG